MTESKRLPEMIVIAGPNGSGKTSVTQKFLHTNGRKVRYTSIRTKWLKINMATGTHRKLY